MRVNTCLNLLNSHPANGNWLLVLFLGIFSLVLFYSDFPLPYGDDLFFAGTAVHFAETGNFLNPGVYDYTEHFSEVRKPYWFVPLHMRSLGWWLFLTGVSDTSIRIYVLLCIVVTILAIIKWSKIAQDKSNLIPYLIPIIIAFGFRWSLRPECTAIPLWTIGAYFLFHSHSKSKFWLGVSFLGLACLASQILIVPSAFLVGASIFRNSGNLSLLSKLQIIVIGVLQSLFFGTCLINFEVAEFVKMFGDHVAARSSSITDNFAFFYFMVCKLGNGYILRLPSFVLLIIAFVLLLKSQSANKPILISSLFSLFLMICIYAKSFEVILYLTTILTLIAVFELKKSIMPLVGIIAALVFVRQGLHLFTYNLLCESSKPEENIEIDKEKTYIIDEFTIRHPLNWNFPLNWKIAPDFGTTNERLLEKPESETWLISLKNLAYFYPELYAQEKLQIVQKEFTNLPKKYWEYKIIP